MVINLKMEKIFFILLIMAFVFPLVSADTISPTRTKVYLEQNGISISDSIQLEIEGYGYSTGMPPNLINKEPGTYTPEKKKSIEINYTKSGEIIYDPYYMNYIHFDYWEIKGKTKTGQEFIIRDINTFSDIVNCEYNPTIEKDEKYYRYKDIKKVTACSEEDENSRSAALSEYCEEFYAVAPRCTSKTYNEIIGTPLEMDSEECNPFFVEVNTEEAMDDKNHTLEQFCEIRLDLNSATWINSENPFKNVVPDNNQSQNPSPTPAPEIKRTIFQSIGCFFKGLFGKGC